MNLVGTHFDEALRREPSSLAANQPEMEDRFYQPLDFGTEEPAVLALALKPVEAE